MVLSEEDKKKIEDFMLHKINVNPMESISQENIEEASKYAWFIMNRAILKKMSKLCNMI